MSALIVPSREIDKVNWQPVAYYMKWNDFDALDRKGLVGLAAHEILQELPPDEAGVWDYGNLLCTPGITRMLNLLIAAGGQGFTNTYARLGTGNGVAAATAADTDLGAAAGAANRWFRAADATFPSVAANVLSMQATWPTGDGNYAWNEWGIDLGGAGAGTSSAVVGAPLLNHKVPGASLGTKAAGATWALGVSISLT